MEKVSQSQAKAINTADMGGREPILHLHQACILKGCIERGSLPVSVWSTAPKQTAEAAAAAAQYTQSCLTILLVKLNIPDKASFLLYHQFLPGPDVDDISRNK